MDSSAQDRRLGRIARKNQLISQQQLDECLAEQAGSSDYVPLGLLLIRKGYLDDQQLITLSEVLEREASADAEARKGVIQDILLATLVVQRGLLSTIQLRDCVEAQQRSAEEGMKLRLGQVMVREKLIPTETFVDLLQDDYIQEFRCEQCEQPFDLGKLKPGASVTCSGCGTMARVPTIEQLLAMLQSGEHAVQQRRRSARRKAAKSKRKRKTAPSPPAQQKPAPEEEELEDVPSLELDSDQLVPAAEPAIESAPEASGASMALRAMMLQGTNKIGPYEVIEEIAAGGMGIVFKARQEGLNRIVALKILKDRVDAGSEQVQRFQREARAASLMNHQNIVSIIEVGNADGLHYMVMDYLVGTPLDEIIEEDGRIEPKRAMRLMEQITDAIAYAHSCNVVHRDLKPSNVIVDPDDSPHITDFGLAKRLDSKSKLTETGALVGTPYYMAPEQILEGSGVVKKSWDIYALGVMMYEMLTGQLPFNGETTMEVYHQILNEEPRPPRQLVRAIPPAVERICMKAMVRDEASRYRSVAELRADVKAFLEGRQVSARPPGFFGRLRRRYEMYTLLYTIVACSVLVILGIVLILTIRKVKSARAVRPPASHSQPSGEQGQLPAPRPWRLA